MNKKEKKQLRFCILLGVVEFIAMLKHSVLSSLHHVPLDGTGSDGVDQINHWQAGADQFVLQEKKGGETRSNINAALC